MILKMIVRNTTITRKPFVKSKQVLTRLMLNGSVYRSHEIDENHGLYKIATFIIFIVFALSLIAIYFLCPLNRNRQRFIKKKKKKKYFDTRSISAETEFDFMACNKRIEEPRHYPSILKNESFTSKNGLTSATHSHASTLREPLLPDTYTTTNKSNTNNTIGPTMKYTNNTTVKHASLSNSLNLLSSRSRTQSRGQLRDRTASVVHFNLDDKTTTDERFDSVVGQKLQSRSRELETRLLNHNQRRRSQHEYNSQPPLGKRYSSSQDLTQQSREEEFPPRQSKIKFNSYASMPDFNAFRKEEFSRSSGVRTPEAKRKNQDLYEVTGIPVSGDDTDEGQMQCTIAYDHIRSVIIVKNLDVQATFPVGVPGFIVEVHLTPKICVADAVRSKVYVTVQQDVSVQLEEVFNLKCDHRHIEKTSVVISIIPLLGNLLLFAETELAEIGLPDNEVYLGGFLKGVYTQASY